MWLRRFLILAAALTCYAGTGHAEPQAAPGQMDNFSLSGMGERGKKNWDLSGRSADIGAQVIRLNDVKSTLYGDASTVHLTAREGDFDRGRGQLHLEKDVVVTTSTGTKLTTDELDWDKKAKEVSTPAQVNIEKEDMVITARGARGRTDLDKLDFQKDVQVLIDEPGKESAGQGPVTIRCDGPLQVDYAANTAVFHRNVNVLTGDCRIESEQLEVFFQRGPDAKNSPEDGMGGSKIQRIVARGNVKITRSGNVSYCEEAMYTAADRKIVLSGSPRLIIYPAEEGKSASAGN